MKRPWLGKPSRALRAAYTQFLAQMIQAAGYDGRIFPSAMGSGKLLCSSTSELRKWYESITSGSRVFKSYADVYDEAPYDHALSLN